MVKDKFVLQSQAKADLVREWFKTGRGVYRWTNNDLGNPSAPDMITPGDATQAPHWAYVGQPTPVTPDELSVEIRKAVEPVYKDHPVCQYCKGEGKRTYQAIADLRNEPVEKAREELRKMWPESHIDDGFFTCRSCWGSGHNVEPITFRVKRLPPYKGGGYEVSKAGQDKCERMCRRLEKYHGLEKVEWDWELREYGMGKGIFFTVERTDFTV